MPDISNELVMKASQGDVAAFEEIYKAMSTFVYNVAFRITNNRDNADEVTQDVFVKVYDNLRNFGFRSSFKTWIYRITANTAINYSKSKAKYERGKVEYDPVVHDVQIQGDVRSELDRADSEKRISSLLDLLDPDQRACIVLREIEGFDYQSIADTLHININTVRSRLKRAREKLMEAGRKG
ncbi:MAG: RNA polymerase sigma factor [Candidatus Omnitrophica bacterium]|nr:RNA polymerase sigma factor [Candidatus Omnitrophota bacterium]